jgi:sortase A
MKIRSVNGWRGFAFYSLVVIALLAIGAWILIGTDLLSGGGEEPAKRDSTPTAERDAPRGTVDRSAAVEWAARERALAAEKEAEEKAAAEKEAAEKKVAAEKKEAARPADVAPPNTTMYLTVPKLGLNDVLVQDGTTETVLSQGVGHLPGTGFPWQPGANTYIAGHRLGYPGTASDHIFWQLPALAPGDEITLTDSNGHTYTYRVSKTLEVLPTDMSVTAPVPGQDILTLQTCIENYGDYWTAGPNWFVRFLVQADRVS